MDITTRHVRIYRWIVLLLAAGYLAYQIATGTRWEAGGAFRFLTIWALALSCYSASRMLALSYGRITRGHEVTAMCASVLNVMVVFLYWKLFFEDPALVNGSGHIPFLEQYYLHALGPALQVVDALFIGRVFRRAQRAVLPLLALIVAYVSWAELFVQPRSDAPSGPVTSGLPYPFLNALDFPDRLVFYASNGAVALLVLGGFALIAVALRRVLPAQHAHSW
ncbi:MAG: hypothetical protein AAGF79_07005 [Pseudomonadota bacterium]